MPKKKSRPSKKVVFAWFPVRLIDGYDAWLVRVIRRTIAGENYYAPLEDQLQVKVTPKLKETTHV